MSRLLHEMRESLMERRRADEPALRRAGFFVPRLAFGRADLGFEERAVARRLPAAVAAV